MNRILIVDDDDNFRNTLLKALRGQTYQATGLADPDSIAATIAIQRPDVILLDMMFENGIEGLSICRKLRTWCSIPIVILSVIDDENSKVAVLDAGADDYLTKPFGINELLARLRAVQRRLGERNGMASPITIAGDLLVNLDDRQVKLRNETIHLTKKEFALLKCLADAQGRLVTYEAIMTALWNQGDKFERGKLRGLVMHLRNKLGEDLSNPTYILTEPGIGYRLNMETING